MSDREEYEALYQAYLERCNAHDFDGMTAFYTPTITVNDAPTPAHAVTEQFAPLVHAFPDWRWEVRSLVTDRDLIALHFTVTGTHLGSFQGIEATGLRIAVPEFTLYRVEDGKFAQVWDLLDVNTLLAQIGAH
jgi:aspartyl-tRNA synthetase